MNIAAAIEKNRIALLRLVFCWLAAASCVSARGDKPLPRRLARYVSGLICAAEKATGYLLIAIFYRSQINRYINPAFERAAMNLMVSNRSVILGALTVDGIIKRLKALQHTLHNLRSIARQLAKSIAARARVCAMNIVASGLVTLQYSACRAHLPEDAVPP